MSYLGIDGGGSKTVFLLVDENDQEICRVQTGPSNWNSVGRDAAASAIREGVARLTGPVPEAVCGGFAGAGRKEGVEFFRSVLEPLFPHSRVRIESDAVAAYVGALGLRPGVLLIAGTGSIAIGRTPDGKMVRAGGWGPQFGDEGSGYWMGREAIQIALQFSDFGIPEDHPLSDFARLIAAKLGLASIGDVVSAWRAGTIGVPEVAALFPELLAMYPEPPAIGIIQAGANHLKTLVMKLRPRTSTDVLSFAGSVASHPLMQKLIDLPFVQPAAPAERGAVILARSATASSGG